MSIDRFDYLGDGMECRENGAYVTYADYAERQAQHIHELSNSFGATAAARTERDQLQAEVKQLKLTAQDRELELLRKIEALVIERDQLKSWKASLPADWFKDSSLETWFPVAAMMLQDLQAFKESVLTEGGPLSDPVEYTADQLGSDCVVHIDDYNQLRGYSLHLAAKLVDAKSWKESPVSKANIVTFGHISERPDGKLLFDGFNFQNLPPGINIYDAAILAVIDRFYQAMRPAPTEGKQG